jgi:hypothetical protein
MAVKPAQDSQRPIAQRNAMLLPCLHAPARYRPDLRLDVDLVPARADRLARPRGGQDGEFQRSRDQRAVLAQLGHERRQLRIGQCGVVLDLAHLATRRQQLVEMAAPARRVLSSAIAAHFCPVEHGLDAPAQAACRLRLRCPDGLQDLEHERCVDRLHRQCTDDGPGVGRERAGPLRRVLLIAPAGAMRLDVALRALVEGYGPGRIEPCLGALGVPDLDGVNPFVAKPARVQRLRAGCGEAEERAWTETHLPRPPSEHVAVDPGRAALRDLQIQPAPVGIHAWPLRLVHLERSQAPRRPCHAPGLRPLADTRNGTHNGISDYDEGQRTCKEESTSQTTG